MTSELITMGQVSEILGVKSHTIRYFLDRGFVPHVRRNKKYQRVLSPWQVDLLQILIEMRRAGFTTKQQRQYARLFRQGPKTAAARLAMLTTRKHQLWQEIEKHQHSISFIERQEELARQCQTQKQPRHHLDF